MDERGKKEKKREEKKREKRERIEREKIKRKTTRLSFFPCSYLHRSGFGDKHQALDARKVEGEAEDHCAADQGKGLVWKFFFFVVFFFEEIKPGQKESEFFCFLLKRLFSLSPFSFAAMKGGHV